MNKNKRKYLILLCSIICMLVVNSRGLYVHAIGLGAPLNETDSEGDQISPDNNKDKADTTEPTTEQAKEPDKEPSTEPVKDPESVSAVEFILTMKICIPE